ncbi:phage baseplate assembly protein [Afifella pfennigii]|uniref:phage baseplate assembly protein n=1 Tax=Afifella pfennigii TaxID=209897 RepID=UPI00047DBE1D|nr:phage baseplate assembly protein [Afifella pfennigii]
MDRETAGKLRGMIRRCTLKNVKDDGEMQTCSVEVAAGVWRDDVEVLQPYGFAAHVPEDGALGIVLAVEGDEGNIVVLPVANPSKRMGKLAAGEVALYNAHGDKMALKPGGDLDIRTGATVSVKTKSAVTVESKGNVTVKAEGEGHLS